MLCHVPVRATVACLKAQFASWSALNSKQVVETSSDPSIHFASECNTFINVLACTLVLSRPSEGNSLGACIFFPSTRADNRSARSKERTSTFFPNRYQCLKITDGLLVPPWASRLRHQLSFLVCEVLAMKKLFHCFRGIACFMRSDSHISHFIASIAD